MTDETNIIGLYNDADEGLKESFLENNSSTLNVKALYDKVEFDYSWLEKIEETITDLDTIIRNPKKFIVQEEEVVSVEKAKKLTIESIKHLATHTNLIQDFDEVKCTITPSKVLNINKEESYDMYENRFIYSLLVNLQMFVAKRKELTQKGSQMKSSKKLDYTAQTKLGSEEVKLTLTLESKAFEDLVGKNNEGLGLSERLDRVQMVLSDFMKSPFIKELISGHALMVKSPIRKTNVILKNQNFQKALELWEFIESYDVNNVMESHDAKDYKDEGVLKECMDNAFLVDYLVADTLSIGEKKKSKKVKKYYISKLVRDFIEFNDDYDEEKFKKLLNDEFALVINEKRKREDRIYSNIKKELDKFKDNNKAALDILGDY